MYVSAIPTVTIIMVVVKEFLVVSAEGLEENH
jgi:hypothetical protein